MLIQRVVISGIIVCMLMLSFSFTTTDIVGVIIPKDTDNYPDSNAPEWELGDKWTMGFEESITDEDFKSELPADEQFIFDYVKMDFDLTIGMFESLEVLENGIVIDETDCYKTKFESYDTLSGVAEIKMDIDENDYQEIMEKTEELEDDYYEDDYYDDSEGSGEIVYKEESSDAFEDIEMSISADYSGYVWMQSDLVGNVFFTEDDLAVVKEEMEYRCDADIYYEFDLDMYVKESYMTTNLAMKGNFKINMDNVVIKYTTTYDPPLQIIDYPIGEYDYWDSESTGTFEITSSSGTVTYNFAYTANFPEEDTVSESGTINLAKESFSDNPYKFEIDIWGESGEKDNVKMCDGSSESCDVILLEHDTYEHFDWNDEYRYYEDQESSFAPFEEDPFSSAADFADVGYTNTIASGNAYYSEDEGYIVQEELTDFNFIAGTGGSAELISPVGMGTLFIDEETLDDEEVVDFTLRPKEYKELQAFKETGRTSIKSDFDGLKENYNKEQSASETDDLLMYSIVSIIIVVILAIVALSIILKRKKAKKQLQSQIQYQPQPQAQPHYQTPYQQPPQAQPQTQPQPQYQTPYQQPPQALPQPQPQYQTQYQQPPQPQPQTQPQYPPPRY